MNTDFFMKTILGLFSCDYAYTMTDYGNSNVLSDTAYEFQYTNKEFL